jgi:glucokinase
MMSQNNKSAMPAHANDYALALDIGGTKIAAALVNRQGAVIHRHTRPTRADLGAPAILQTTREAGREMLDTAGRYGLHVSAIGIGTGGQVDVTQGRIAYASDTLPGWSGLQLGAEVEHALKLPTFVDNDVNAVALGEHYFGAGRGYDAALYVAVGTGVGGALVLDGKIWRGSTWSAGEICHLVIDFDGKRRCSCGATGHLEAYTSGPAMAQRYRELSGTRESPDLKAIAAYARQGDSHALRAIAEGAQILGMTLGGVLNIFDPQLVVIGGGVPEMGDLWWRHFETALRANPMPGPANVHVAPAQLGTDAALAGAAWLAFNGLTS